MHGDHVRPISPVNMASSSLKESVPPVLAAQVLRFCSHGKRPLAVTDQFFAASQLTALAD
eukprot:scaffold192691_cov43-Prasinocladus_malaysianus.AAC.1